MAEDALTEARRLTEEARSVNDDATLSDAEKRERIEKIVADADAKRAEARSHIEQGEREAEVRSLSERAGRLVVPTADKRDANGRDLASELRAVGLGQSRSVTIEADGDELRTALTTNSANAGTTVDTTFVAQVIQSLRDSSPFLSTGVRIVHTATGEQMDWPVKNGRLVAARVAEGDAYSKSDMSFTRTSLHAWKYGVIAEASIEMLQDSALDISGLLATDIGEALADESAADFLTGDGASKPQGLLTGVTLGSVSAAHNPTFDELITLQHSVISKYRRNAVWYTSDEAVLALRLVQDNEGRYIWQDSVTAGSPDTLLGKPVFTDPNMPAPSGVSVKSVAFGDFGRCYVVRFARNVEVVRSDEYGFDTDVVAFKGRVRVDGAVQDGAAVAALTTPAA